MVNSISTKNVSNFHSVSFDTTAMQMRRYFTIGQGIVQKYSDSDFQSGLLVKIPFHSSDFIPMITVTPQSTSTPKITFVLKMVASVHSMKNKITRSYS